MNQGRRRRDPGTPIAFLVLALVYMSFGHALGKVEDKLAWSEPTREIELLKAGDTVDPTGITVQTTVGPMSASARAGQAVYETWCIGCHGPSGGGDGPSASALHPKPRNFQTGLFKFITSQPNTLPRHEDLMKTVTMGLPGSSMPSFRLLPEQDRRDVVEFILHQARNARRWKLLKAFVEEGIEDADEEDKFTKELYDEILEDNASLLKPKEAKAFFPETPEPAVDEDGLVQGYVKFMSYCNSCHGDHGEGLPMLETDGSGPTLDEFGEPSRPRNLTTGIYRHGTDALSIWYRIRRGLDGAVMPAASWSAEEAWNVSHFTQLLFDAELQKRFELKAIKAKGDAILNEKNK